MSTGEKRSTQEPGSRASSGMSVQAMLAEYVASVAGHPVVPGAALVEEGILDSMEMVLFVHYVEQTFEIEANTDDLAEGVFRTIESTAAFVACKRAEP